MTAALTWQQLRDIREGFSRCEAPRTQGTMRGERCAFRGRYDGFHGLYLCEKHLDQREQGMLDEREMLP